jgi:hypothetical protein
MTNRTRRLVAGAFAAATVALPLYAAIATDATPDLSAGPPCLATIRVQGALNEQCLSYSNGNGITAGTPWYNGGNSPNSGWSSGPLFPGQTIREGVGVP